MRLLAKVVVGLAVPLGLLTAVDRVAVGVAERALAAEVQRTEELTQRPSVDIVGFPFLTQALGGRYDRIELRARGLGREGLEVARFEATLRGVGIPFRDVVSGSVDAVPADEVEATAFVTYDEMERQVGSRGLDLSAAGRLVRVRGRVSGIAVDVLSRVEVRGREVRVRAERVASGGVSLGVLGARFDITLRIPALPFDLRLTGVRVAPDALAISAEGHDVVLRP